MWRCHVIHNPHLNPPRSSQITFASFRCHYLPMTECKYSSTHLPPTTHNAPCSSPQRALNSLPSVQKTTCKGWTEGLSLWFNNLLHCTVHEYFYCLLYITLEVPVSLIAKWTESYSRVGMWRITCLNQLLSETRWKIANSKKNIITSLKKKN